MSNVQRVTDACATITIRSIFCRLNGTVQRPALAGLDVFSWRSETPRGEAIALFESWDGSRTKAITEKAGHASNRHADIKRFLAQFNHNQLSEPEQANELATIAHNLSSTARNL